MDSRFGTHQSLKGIAEQLKRPREEEEEADDDFNANLSVKKSRVDYGDTNQLYNPVYQNTGPDDTENFGQSGIYSNTGDFDDEFDSKREEEVVVVEEKQDKPANLLGDDVKADFDDYDYGDDDIDGDEDEGDAESRIEAQRRRIEFEKAARLAEDDNKKRRRATNLAVETGDE